MIDILRFEDGNFAFTDLDRKKPFERHYGSHQRQAQQVTMRDRGR